MVFPDGTLLACRDVQTCCVHDGHQPCGNGRYAYAMFLLVHHFYDMPQVGFPGHCLQASRPAILSAAAHCSHVRGSLLSRPAYQEAILAMAHAALTTLPGRHSSAEPSKLTECFAHCCEIIAPDLMSWSSLALPRFNLVPPGRWVWQVALARIVSCSFHLRRGWRMHSAAGESHASIALHADT